MNPTQNYIYIDFEFTECKNNFTYTQLLKMKNTIPKNEYNATYFTLGAIATILTTLIILISQ